MRRWRVSFSEAVVKMDEKTKILVKLFACYPSTVLAGSDQATMMLAGYLETLSSISPQALSAACDAIRRRGERFPPSAGEIYAECENLASGSTAFDDRWQKALKFVGREHETLAKLPAPATDFRAPLDELSGEIAAACPEEKPIRTDAIDWTQPITPTPVTRFSEKLVAQLRGEEPIGDGKLGPRPVIDASHLEAAE